jgi:hypothetical protein
VIDFPQQCIFTVIPQGLIFPAGKFLSIFTVQCAGSVIVVFSIVAFCISLCNFFESPVLLVPGVPLILWIAGIGIGAILGGSDSGFNGLLGYYLPGPEVNSLYSPIRRRISAAIRNLSV